MPFTPCLDVTLRVAAVPATARAAVRLREDFAQLARHPRHWPFRYLEADAQGDALVVRALLLEPIEDLYGAAPLRDDELLGTDVVLELLNAHSAEWRALDVGEQPVRSSAHRVHRRLWTVPLGDGRRTRRRTGLRAAQGS